jgi:quercetin dioxygenase-like cupin family protein
MNVWRVDDPALYDEKHFTIRHLFESNHLVVVWFGFVPGQVLRDHQTSSHALIQCISGAIRVESMGETVELTMGMSVVIEPHVVHALYANERALVQLSITPHPSQHSLLDELQLSTVSGESIETKP